ncbi:hypothetical protein MN116_005615 [Schistosoma mekongi]|uniref:FHF complex subunit HOOK-interacting protein C-terminal domain-containing protein n=1 Tax=Schistosoma mekongi TaxID=38744 RepID=A0AAE2D426_SCHME|nr:hypothetical protein MN116_005615 [Schistosoma mekongi]
MHKSKSDMIVQTGDVQEFDDHWTNCRLLIKDADNTVLSTPKIELIFYHVGKIIHLVVGEHSSNVTSERNKPMQGSYLEAIIKNNVFESLLIWIEGNPTPKDEKLINIRNVLRGNLIVAFEQLITQSKQNVLLHRPILQPLCHLLFKLSSQLRPSYDQLYGRLLHEVCILLCRNIQLLEFSKELCSEIFNQPYMIFSLLVPLVHRNDQLGDSARDSLLIIFALSKKDDNVGHYLAYESDICPVLATGLSGLYSSLPKKLVPRYGLRYNNGDISVKSPGGPVSVTTPIYIQSDLLNPCLLELQVGGAEWHQLTENECSNSIDLRRFLHTLHFCNLTVKIAHPDVRDQLLHFIHSGFLIPVLGSALHQSAMDEVIASTAYLELFLRRLTEPSMIKLFLKFIVMESHDSYHILTSIMNRLNANAVLVTDKLYQLGMVTLSLFRTILSFHCEDVMYELIFKHLLTLNHLDPGKLNTSSGLNKTYLTGSALCLSSNGATMQPKLLWSTSPRLNSISAIKHTTYYHPTVDQLVPGLVKSAELFLSLANTSYCNDKFSRCRHQSTVNNSEVDTSLKNEKKKKSSSVSYCPVEKLRKDSKEVIYTGSGSSMPTTDPLTSLNPSRNYTDSVDNYDDYESNLNETLNNEWVVIRNTAHPILLTNNYPELINYIKNSNLRVSRRRQACKSWHSEYWPKMLENNLNKSSPIKDDNLLDLQEKQSRCDLHRTVSSKYATSGCITPDFILNPLSTRIPDKSTSDIIDTCDKNEVLDALSSPLLLHSLSNKHTSSLYQLNYLNDSSDDENNQVNMKQVKSSNTTDNDDINTDSPTITPYNTVAFIAADCIKDTVDETITLFNKHLSTAYSSESLHSITMNKISQIQQSQLSTTLKVNNQKEREYNAINDDLNENDSDCNIRSSCTGMSYIPPSVNSMPPCTCLSRLPDLLRLAHLDPSIEIRNHQNSNNTDLSTTKLDFNERQEYELENFLAALDCLPSPGHCKKHFGHLPPFISYSKIDEEFFKKLDNYIQEFENPKVNTTGTDAISSVIPVESTTKNENNYHDDHDDVVAKMKSEHLNSHVLPSLMSRSFNDALDSISLDHVDSVRRQQQHWQHHSDSHSCNHSNYSHLTDFSSTSSTQSARHNSNSIGVAGGIGPFLSILLNRLANMHNNCFFTNLLLTDIFAALASYPCPLLYEFLLNPVGLSVKSSVNTLYKVLRSVRSQIVVASESVEQWKLLVFRARVYLNIVWPGPFKMIIDPNFYATKENSQRIKAKTVGQSNTTTTNSNSNRDVSEDQRINSSYSSSNSLFTNFNNSSLNYDSFQHIIPLLPVVYPLSINNEHSKYSPCNECNQHRNYNRINQLFTLTNRITHNSLLKSSSIQPNHHHHHHDYANKLKLFTTRSNNNNDNLNEVDNINQSINDSYLQFNNSDNNTTEFYTDISCKTRNLVYASIIFDEFCYELTSICYEHCINSRKFLS